MKYYGKKSLINTNKVEYPNKYEQSLLKIDFNKNIELNSDNDFEKIKILIKIILMKIKMIQ
jgi:hypothetical protein